VNALSWLLFVAFGAACFATGWEMCDWRQERAIFLAWEERDAAWDAAWRARTGKRQ
jgi:hypothetical protein